MITKPTVESIEQQLADLHQQRADLALSIASADAELAAADATVATAQAVFNAVVVARASAMPEGDAYGTWTPRDARDEERAREAVQRADGMFEQADRELGAALVNRTTVSQRRGFLLMRRHRLDEEIPAVERELELARQAPADDRDLLAGIRASIFGTAG